MCLEDQKCWLVKIFSFLKFTLRKMYDFTGPSVALYQLIGYIRRRSTMVANFRKEIWFAMWIKILYSS